MKALFRSIWKGAAQRGSSDELVNSLLNIEINGLCSSKGKKGYDHG